MREATGIIPARYGATRFPGKPLAPIAGKPMIQRVYESAKRSRNLHRLLIATDDERIRAACRVFGAEVQMTSPHHRSGTERAVEVAKNLTSPIVINIQADEPLITGEAIDALIQALQEENLPVATLAARVEDSVNFADPNRVKVVMDTEGNALYFSRAPIPYRPGGHFWQHIGVYGYQRDFLLKFPNLPA
ncbi:MAG: 3-deoxy-manno-octulosonate cytidylyltransferase, partial [Candidatus Aminicenantales bacterium]